MTESMIAATIFLSAVLAAVIVIFAATKGTPKLTYRTVKRRFTADDGGGGEIVVLECGHAFRLQHNHRSSFPCEQCDEEKVSGK